MDINFFREFAVLARTGSYSEAAEQLFLSQPSLSKHIKSAELELGQPLFRRTTRRIELTPFGAALLPYAEQIAALQDAYSAQLLHVPQEKAVISLGLGYPLLEFILNTAVHSFQAAHPEYQVTLKAQDTPELKRSLVQKSLDLIIIHDVAENDSAAYVKQPIEYEYLEAVLPPDHSLAGRDHIGLTELRDAPFLMLPEKTIVYELAVGACRAAGFEPNVVFTSPSCENIFYLIEKGNGVSIVAPKHLPAHDNVRLVPILPPIRTAVSVCYRADHLSPAAALFLDHIRDRFPDAQIKLK